MNDCPQNAWFWEVRRNCNSVWPLLDTAGAACLSRSNPYTVFLVDYIFLCFLSHIKAHANVYILPVLQSLGKSYGLITPWTEKGTWSQNHHLFWGFPRAHGAMEKVVSISMSVTWRGSLAKVLEVELRLCPWAPLSHPLHSRETAGLDALQSLLDLGSTHGSRCHYSSYKSLPEMRIWA